MKLPWDKKYLTVSFYIIFTLAAIYACKLVFDAAVYFIVNADIAVKAVMKFIGGVFSAFEAVVIAFVITYLFDPLVDFFQNIWEKVVEKKKKNEPEYKRRTTGTVTLYLIFIILLSVPVASLVGKINDGGPEAVLGGIGDTVAKVSSDFSDLLVSAGLYLAERGSMAFLMNIIGNIYEKLSAFIKNAGETVALSIPSLGNFILNFLLGLVIAFYFLRDKAGIKEGTENFAKTLLPYKAYVWIKRAICDVHDVFSGYIRGQFADAAIVAGMIWVWLSLIRVDFALIIAILSGISNMVPYLGAFVCYALAVTVAFFSGAPVKALYAAIGIFVIQQIDGIVIVPRVVGKSVELSPVSVIISLAVAGELFGIAGMVFAVPVCAVVKLFLTRMLERLKEKRG